jgi:hypothetical protein
MAPFKCRLERERAKRALKLAWLQVWKTPQFGREAAAAANIRKAGARVIVDSSSHLQKRSGKK